MSVSGVQLSLSGRAAIATPGGARASQRQQLDPVSASEPLKDPTSSEYRELQALKARDREVRQHEQAHVAAGGAHVRGGASFSYETGPDGRRYAVGGEVSIDTSAVSGDPEATIRKMQAVRQAALAPAEPSAQDRAVAADAAHAEAQARIEVREQQAGEVEGAADAAGSARARSAVAAYQGAAGANGSDAARDVLDLIA